MYNINVYIHATEKIIALADRGLRGGLGEVAARKVGDVFPAGIPPIFALKPGILAKVVCKVIGNVCRRAVLKVYELHLGRATLLQSINDPEVCSKPQHILCRTLWHCPGVLCLAKFVRHLCTCRSRAGSLPDQIMKECIIIYCLSCLSTPTRHRKLHLLALPLRPPFFSRVSELIIQAPRDARAVTCSGTRMLPESRSLWAKQARGSSRRHAASTPSTSLRHLGHGNIFISYILYYLLFIYII